MKFLLTVMACVAVAMAAPVDEPAGDDDSVQVEAAPDPTLAPLLDLSAPHATFIDPFNSIKIEIPDASQDSAIYTLFSGLSSPYEYVPIQARVEKQELPVAAPAPAWQPGYVEWNGQPLLTFPAKPSPFATQ